MSLNELVVSLENSGRGGYLKITIDLEVVNQETADIVVQKLPKLRHIAIMSLTTKTVDDIRSHSGKSALNAELFRKFGDVLPKDTLTGIFFWLQKAIISLRPGNRWRNFSIRHGAITTIHDVTNTQTIVDRPAKDMRRARSA